MTPANLIPALWEWVFAGGAPREGIPLFEFGTTGWTRAFSTPSWDRAALRTPVWSRMFSTSAWLHSAWPDYVRMRGDGVAEWAPRSFVTPAWVRTFTSAR